jgi:hypothetical protein
MKIPGVIQATPVIQVTQAIQEILCPTTQENTGNSGNSGDSGDSGNSGKMINMRLFRKRIHHTFQFSNIQGWCMADEDGDGIP